MGHRMAVVLGVLGLGLVLADGALARTWMVAKDGSGDATVIQDALDQAAVGDTVLVGAGRYDEFQPYFDGDLKIVAFIDVDSLTLRGVDRDAVILGPEVAIPGAWNDVYAGVRVEDVRGVRVERLTLEGTTDGIYTVGEVRISEIRSRGHSADGIRNSSPYPLQVYDSLFEDNVKEAGILTGPLDHDTVIERCVFRNNKYGVLSIKTPNVLIADCDFDSPANTQGIMIQQSASGVVRDCRFGDGGLAGIIMDAGVELQLLNNRFKPTTATVNLRVVFESHVTGSGNVFGGGWWATIEMIGSAGADLHGNDIYKTSPYAVKVEDYHVPPISPLNFQDNYWGTDNPDSVSSWILYDNIDPGTGAEVFWEPIRDTPVPAEATSTGSFKALFGGR